MVENLSGTPEKSPEAATQASEPSTPEEGFRVMVSLANPESEKNLITIAAAFAKQHGGTVMAVHIVQVPDQTTLEVGAEHIDQLDRNSQKLLDKARRDAETLGVEVETHTILSHRVGEEIFDAAVDQKADKVVVGWGADSHGSPGRFEDALKDLTGDLPCDFVVYKDCSYDPARILLPTAGGPDADVSAEIAHALLEEYDSELTLMHVVREESERAAGEAFLEHWAEEHHLEDAARQIAVSGDAYGAIEEAAKDHSLMILGATEKGLLRRLADRDGVAKVIERSGISVILAEQARDRSLRERLFGS